VSVRPAASPFALGAEGEREHCAHEREGLRYRQWGSSKSRQFVMQCLRCGKQMRAVAKDDPLVRNLAALPPEWDADLPTRYWQDVHAERQGVWARRREEQREAYRVYLLSPEWRAKRQKRLTLDGWRCQAMLTGCLVEATEVHHLTYVHCGNEAMFDLQSVCRVCHDQLTEMEGRGGETGYERAS
jgi:hypothetical protein